MLTTLYVKNYALIDDLKINWADKFSTITGETGSGKSVLLGALGLVLGNRIDKAVLKDTSQKCVIEAEFDLSNYALESVFVSNELDFDSQTIIRRVIAPSGKSRVFINDEPVSLKQLQNIGKYLIDIHTQNQTSDLLTSDFQLDLIDKFVNNQELLLLYKQKFRVYQRQEVALNQLNDAYRASLKENEYNQFAYNELEQADLKVGQQDEFEYERSNLSNVEQIKESLFGVIELINQEQYGVAQQLFEIKNKFKHLDFVSKDYLVLAERVEAIELELSDIEQYSQSVVDQLIDDPVRLSELDERLRVLYDLQKKYLVETEQELIDIKSNFYRKTTDLDQLKNQIATLTLEQEKLKEELINTANQLSESRKSAAKRIADQIQSLLALLGMAESRVFFELSKSEGLLKNGVDKIKFLFSANIGSSLVEVKKSASGGELSRIMFAVKSLLASSVSLPTIIFDEIDTGVSGEIALNMANMMREMGVKRQVIAITHLPQVAAKGVCQFKVYKEHFDDKTSTKIIELSEDKRVEEIAQMISGKTYSQSAVDHAKSLLVR